MRIVPQQRMDGAFDLNLSPVTAGCRDESKAFDNKFWKQIASSQSLSALRCRRRDSDSPTRPCRQKGSRRKKARDSLAPGRKLARAYSRRRRIGNGWDMSSGGLKV